MSDHISPCNLNLHWQAGNQSQLALFVILIGDVLSQPLSCQAQKPLEHFPGRILQPPPRALRPRAASPPSPPHTCGGEGRGEEALMVVVSRCAPFSLQNSLPSLDAGVARPSRLPRSASRRTPLRLAPPTAHRAALPRSRFSYYSPLTIVRAYD
jgi:hypothetical protein